MRELGEGSVSVLFPGVAVAIVLYGPQFLPGERRMVTLLAAEQRPPLPVICPHLQDGLFEGTRGERVEDGVEGAVDGQNENDHPGAYGACIQMEGSFLFCFVFCAEFNVFTTSVM